MSVKDLFAGQGRQVAWSKVGRGPAVVMCHGTPWSSDLWAPLATALAHDYGGAVALRAHLLHDASYASICLVDVVVLRPWGSAFFTLVRDNAEAFARLPSAVHRGALAAYIA